MRTIDGPDSIPHIVVTPLGNTWNADDNNADAVVYGRIGESLCVGIGWLDEPCSRIVSSRVLPSRPGAVSVAGAGSARAMSVAVDVAGAEPQIVPTVVVPGAPEARFFLVEVPDGAESVTVRWLAEDGTELAAESLPTTDLDPRATDTTVPSTAG